MKPAAKPLLWAVLTFCVALNVVLGLTVDEGALKIVLSAVSGACALGAVVALVVLRRTS
ncbi:MULTISPECIES: hypothetical protein [Streptomyces]|uniref:Uncharacterized protein n=1 Tax=Streptomyces lycii TaxID=2654337 RepID=A0ABQ7FJK2_9ACTN|nr:MULTISPECIES: hypothetical protein [Streptomyces]KAF4407423.1 hypothetical protein GCU69_19695 [Streptomyces lycii]